jgi:cellulose synthase/poly-beta-1,6-N-acetylglucosamine synthase-like glycosyltransferase
VFLSACSYLIYPALLAVLAGIYRRSWITQESTPHISVIISAYNEEAVIEQKVKNTLDLDYPEDRLQVIVSSDGSTDQTNAIVSAIRDPRVTLFSFQERVGKTACLNRVVPEAKGELVLFTDANSMFPKNLLRTLTRNFADPGIGLVTGWTKYHQPGGREETTSLYSKFEKWSKVLESRVSSCVGADGAVFAIRKALYKPLKDYDINDFIIPLDVIGQGLRVVLDPEVFCLEEASEGVGKEYSRQVRITTRTLGAIGRNTGFLDPFKYGAFAFMLFSHKVMRFLVPFFIMGAFFSNLMALNQGAIFKLCFSVQVLILAWSILSLAFRFEGKISRILTFFLTTFGAQAAGWFRMLVGVKDTTWKPQR